VWVVSGRYFAQVVDRYVREEGSIGHRISTTPSPSLGDLLAHTWNLPEHQQRSAALLFVSCFGVIENGTPVVCVCVCACVCVCVRARARVCVRVRVCVSC
jgi:hypothetical protein